ncbi:protein FAM170A-like isoform X2 [Acinonyx jubatus]|uniref:Protein FAM170A-like isoform X2 n=1 Tax=Acinonyx jubatus TaxID=32536 RepID=A0ABM3PWU4_ACIJB|nr:protein FAM170A-like isoform X2 [Acinonyx jubatus]XP_053076149.1 protein FAM170A-like isoform X2 [Acinonyx jubatus]
MKQKQKRKHLESTYFPETSKKSRGIPKSHKYDPPPEYSLEDSTLVSEAKDGHSELKYFSCNSSFHHHPYVEVLKSGEDSSHSGPSRLVQFHNQMAKVSGSEQIFGVPSPDRPIHSEVTKGQEDVPPAESCVVVPACNQAAEEKSSVSEYFSCVSFVRKLVPVDECGIHQLHQGVSCLGYQLETSSPFPHVSFPFPLVSDTKSSFTSEDMKEERLMKIYYMRVQMKRGVAALCDTEEGLEPPSKKTRIEEMTFLEKSPTEATLSYVGTKELLTDSESSWNNEDQEEQEEVESPAEPPAVDECSRAKTPEWLVSQDSGVRCMGCCRVFPTLEVLQQHVQHGISEGFSCRTFHLTLTWLKSKKSRIEKKKRRKRNKVRKIMFQCQKGKHFGMKSSHK